MDLYSIRSTSGASAEGDPIILRETATTRLVFKPLLVNNAKHIGAPVKGWFMFQRKGIHERWEDHAAIPLNKLRSGEGIKLELKAGELHEFLTHVAGLYRLFKGHGLPKGKTHFLKIRDEHTEFETLQELDIPRLMRIARHTGVDAISGVLDWLAGLDDAVEIVDHLQRLEINSLRRINSLIGASTLRALIHLWEVNQANTSEEFWQQTLQEYAFILTQVFAFPVVLFKGKAYVGGKGLENSGGHVADFLLTNQLTRNAVLVEIKTPSSRLLGKQYRGGGVFPVSEEVSGAISQVLTYRQSLVREIDTLASGSSAVVEAFSPHCLVLIGHFGKQLQNPAEVRSFELFRGALNADVVVLTFDELFAKAQALLELVEGGEQNTGATR